MTRRIRIHLGVGDLMETLGAVLACYAVAHLAGLMWGLLLAAAFLIIAGNLIYAGRHVSMPLPSRWDFVRASWLARKRWVKAKTAASRALVRS